MVWITRKTVSAKIDDERYYVLAPLPFHNQPAFQHQLRIYCPAMHVPDCLRPRGFRKPPKREVSFKRLCDFKDLFAPRLIAFSQPHNSRARPVESSSLDLSESQPPNTNLIEPLRIPCEGLEKFKCFRRFIPEYRQLIFHKLFEIRPSLSSCRIDARLVSSFSESELGLGMKMWSWSRRSVCCRAVHEALLVDDIFLDAEDDLVG